MDLRLSPISSTPIPRTGSTIRTNTPTVGGAESAGFSTALKGALKDVSNAQNTATQLQQEVQMENPNVSLEETMVAIQKAQIGFQATLHVRNRMVQAYSDIMNMQV
jgi:flagellar hook-basal body complex protein FliE